MTEKIRIKYFTDKIERLCYIGGKSDWIDLRAAEEIELKAGEFQLIPLGIAMELPAGYEAHVEMCIRDRGRVRRPMVLPGRRWGDDEEYGDSGWIYAGRVRRMGEVSFQK